MSTPTRPMYSEELAAAIQTIVRLTAELQAASLDARRYKTVRSLNVPQFKDLFDRGLKGERFDDMVDEHGEAHDK